jgi:hypothetical protein
VQPLAPICQQGAGAPRALAGPVAHLRYRRRVVLYRDVLHRFAFATHGGLAHRTDWRVEGPACSGFGWIASRLHEGTHFTSPSCLSSPDTAGKAQGLPPCGNVTRYGRRHSANLAHWQAHSVRGFLSGTAKKKLGLTVERITEDGRTIYRVLSVPV